VSGRLPHVDLPAGAGFTFGEPTHLDVATRFFPTSDCPVSCFSSDGLEMFVSSDHAGGKGAFDIWVLKRASPEDDWGPPENLGPAVNSASMDQTASISGDGLELYFFSGRPGGYNAWDLYVTRRATPTSPWGGATNLGPKVNSSYDEVGTSVSSDGLELYFSSNRPGAGGLGLGDIYVSKRATTSDPWGDPVNLGPAVNSPFYEQCPCLSPDGLLLFWQSDRPGGFGGGLDLWMARRANRTAPWEPAVNPGPKINGPNVDCRPGIAPDGSALYFSWDWNDRTDLPWKAPIIPLLDFNGDGNVDAADMALVVVNWGKSNSVCDIGPFPWGDGVVDEKDLAVLMESLATPKAKASDVPCDVTLSWVSLPSAQSHDVYLGTSFEAVSDASRANPLDVLVSLGQTETTYDPNGPLEYSRTYYWRIDEVGVPSPGAICKGKVWSFTVAPYSYPMAGSHITASASSSYKTNTPDKTIDGSGLNADDQHSTSAADMWFTTNPAPQPVWIEYAFDQPYVLDKMMVWNCNYTVEPTLGVGVKDVTIEYSTDDIAWTATGDFVFNRATAEATYMANTEVNLGGITAQYVRITIKSNWGGKFQQFGLSEVRFFYLPTDPATEP
jgi:hypothetical protein